MQNNVLRTASQRVKFRGLVKRKDRLKIAARGWRRARSETCRGQSAQQSRVQPSNVSSRHPEVETSRSRPSGYGSRTTPQLASKRVVGRSAFDAHPAESGVVEGSERAKEPREKA